MPVYILSKNVPVNSMVILACSENKGAIEKYRADHHDGKGEISSMDLPFPIQGSKEIYTATCDVDNFNIYVDIGQYFKTHKEAVDFVKSSNEPYKADKFKVESISVV